MAANFEVQMAEAWRDAADQLGIRVVAPYEVASTSFVAHLPDFGGPSGMLVASLEDSNGAGAAAASTAGHYLSRVSDAYAEFDAIRFMDTLNDWGWYGSEAERPAWYSGSSWTS